VAGLIAGNGASSAGAYTGEAPGAGLVSVKVAGASGQTDLATVLAGIAWVVQHRDSLHIGVLNLSFGMLPTVSTVSNPLDQAVEQAWRAGIVVVAAAGNAGPFNGSILSPGDDPLVITAGTVDDQATPTPADDTVPPFSSVGPTSPDGWIKPDVVAPGRSVVSLRAPGSTVDTLFPAARIGAGNFVGSGTSFSAAVTSGAAALLLAQLHGAQPDDVKGRLLAGAAPGPVANPLVDGHGIVSLPGALAVGPGNSVHLVQAAPTQATPVGATVPLSQSWAASAWNGANYRGSFAGLSWNGLSWNGLSWNGLSWNGLSWNGTCWASVSWNGLSWNGSSWS
jgi:serine protease AprX